MSEADIPSVDPFPTHSHVMHSLYQLEDYDAENGIPATSVVEHVVDATGLSSADVRDAIEKLHLNGEVYEPRPDHLRRTEQNDDRWDRFGTACHWQEALVEVRMAIGRGLKPRELVDRYDVEDSGRIADLVTRAALKVDFDDDNEKLTLEDLDKAADRVGIPRIVTDGGSECDTERFRKQAPKLVDGQHPSWYWLVSGGIDSVAAYLLTKDAMRANYGKRPLMTYLETRIGLPFNRLYVEELSDTYDEQLWSLRTHEKIENRIAKRGKYADRDDAGPPGAAQHSEVQNEVKGRQRETLANRDPATIYVTGIRADESEERASHPKGEVSGGIRYVKPVYELTKKECTEIILRHPECPINPGWWWNHYTDCGCSANGDPGENDTVEKRFPAFGQRIREWEEAIPEEGLRSMLGWDGLTAEEKRARKSGQRQLSLCGNGCQRRVPTPIEQAFKARAFGASVEEAVAILHEEIRPSGEFPDLIPATDGGKPRTPQTETDGQERGRDE